MVASRPELRDVALILSNQILELLRDAHVTRADALAALAQSETKKPAESKATD